MNIQKSDEHYRNIENQGPEPIVVMEAIANSLQEAGVPASSTINIILAQKHITRAGVKKGEDWKKEIQKSINYLTRAVTGAWVGSTEKPYTTPNRTRISDVEMFDKNDRVVRIATELAEHTKQPIYPPEQRIEATHVELEELLHVLNMGESPDHIRDELGDVIFNVVALGQSLGFRLSEALESTCKKLEKRIEGMSQGLSLREVKNLDDRVV